MKKKMEYKIFFWKYFVLQILEYFQAFITYIYFSISQYFALLSEDIHVLKIKILLCELI